MARFQSTGETTKREAVSLENGVLKKRGRQVGGHMDFGDWSYGIEITRATAQVGGHTENDFMSHDTASFLATPYSYSTC